MDYRNLSNEKLYDNLIDFIPRSEQYQKSMRELLRRGYEHDDQEARNFFEFGKNSRVLTLTKFTKTSKYRGGCATFKTKKTGYSWMYKLEACSHVIGTKGIKNINELKDYLRKRYGDIEFEIK